MMRTFYLMLFISAVSNGAWASSIVSPAWYVSPTGSDSNSGQSTSTPFLTLEKAQQTMQNSATKTVYLMGGTFQRTGTLTLFAGNDNGESWLAYPGQTPILNGGAGSYDAIHVLSTNLRIRFLTIENYNGNGIVEYNSSWHVIDSNTIFNLYNGNGIISESAVSNSTISHNLIYLVSQHGIHYVADTGQTSNQNITIESNYISNVNTQSGLYDTGGIYINDRPHAEQNIVISDNMIQDLGSSSNGTGARGIYLDDEASNVSVQGNYITGSGAFAFQVHGGDHNTFSNNVFDLSGITEAAGLYEDDVAAGFPNYGMQDNVFTSNIYYMPCQYLAPTWFYAWDLIDSTSGQIAMPSIQDSTYDNINSPVANSSSSIVDTTPTYARTCAPSANLATAIAGVGPVAND
jgi:hypothetical protein